MVPRGEHQLALLTAEVGIALIRSQPLADMLQQSAEAVVRHLNAAVARVWTMRATEPVLELRASAGMPLEGHHIRVPVGQTKIGMIAANRRPYQTNAVIGDPRIADQDWARREQMRSFAGYPLMVGDEVVGVLAAYSREPLNDDDLQALATAANSLALGIERTRTEDRLRAHAERLTRLTGILARTNRELDAFAYAASHDLRAPLRGIANLAQWIEEDLTAAGDLKPDTREMLELMRTRMSRMESLIEGILQYSRAGRTNERVETVDTRALAAGVIDLLALPAGADVEIGPELPTIESAALPLQQVFMNLVGNAIKYNQSPHPRVEIHARDAGSFVEFSVRDNGPGIPREYHERIWGIFQTLEARDKVEGTGIGLSLVRKLVEAQGGRAWVESAPGEGATFRFLWPRRPQPLHDTED
jgi:signal transduction histidine kinase